jgi:hypothetical protein
VKMKGSTGRPVNNDRGEARFGSENYSLGKEQGMTLIRAQEDLTG